MSTYSLLAALREVALIDWLALAWFVAVWWGYASFARRPRTTDASLLATTNRHRREWMMQTTARENRVIDGLVVQALSTSPSFFASTTILIIGGLLAVLGSDHAPALVKEIPFAARTSAFVFDLKLLVLTAVFVYAFFRFTWSMRQYTFGALLIASAPDHLAFERGEASRAEFADRAARVVGLAAETFNDGLRAYYMAFAAILWFFSPIAFALGAGGVAYLLYQREFRSDILNALRH